VRRSAVTRTVLTLLVAISLVFLGGCGSEDEPEAQVEPTAAASAEETPGAEASSAPATPSPSAGSGAGAAAGLVSALADVRLAAPRLESLYRNREYPRELDAVVDSLDEAKLTLAPGNSLGGYRYDEQKVEFVLCVEHESGAFATYDTAPMATGAQGTSGGCPAL
jgi:hypothetical protein